MADIPAGGGAAPSPAGGGAAPPPPAPPPGGGAAPSGAPPAGGGGGGGAPPPAGPRYLERKVTREGKEVTERVKEEALWNAHAREASLNRKFEETTKRERELAAAAEQLQQREERLKKGDFRTWAKENNLDPVETLARELEEAMKEAEQSNDPRTRALLEKSREADKLKAELDGIKTEQQRVEFTQAVEAELEKLAAEFMPALQAVKLPKNDITMRLMAEAKDTAKRYGLPLDAASLAKETHKAAAGMVEGLVEGVEDDEELVEMFPKFSRRLHAGLLKRHKRLTGLNQVPTIPKPKPEDKSTPPPVEGKPRLLNSSEEDKAYFGNKRVLRSGV